MLKNRKVAPAQQKGGTMDEDKKMVEVQVVKPYKDLQKMVLFTEKDIGRHHSVTESRAKELESKGLVKRVKKEDKGSIRQ